MSPGPDPGLTRDPDPRRPMPQVRIDISMSLDGYVAGPNQSLDNPLGVGGEELHE